MAIFGILPNYVEKNTQKMPFLYIEGPKYVSFDNKTLNLKAFVHILTTTIAISHFSLEHSMVVVSDSRFRPCC